MALNCSLLNSSYPCINNTQQTTPATATATTGIVLNDKQKVRIAIYVISIVLSWIGNSLVIAVSVLKRHSLTPCRILMAHLAVTNLLFTIRLPSQIRLELNGYVWEHGLFMCKVFYGFNSATLLASIETVTVIAIERYRGISKPYSSKWTKKNILVSVFIVWTIALITYSPYMAYLELKGTRCSDHYPSITARQVYSVFIVFMRYVIPLAIMSFCYYKVAMVVHRRPTRVSTYHNDDSELARKRENKRVIRILVAIVVAFALLTAPTSIWWLWYDFGGSEKVTRPSLDLVEVFAAFLYLHSAINPIIYGVMDTMFKKGVKELLERCFGCSSASNQVATSRNVNNVDNVNKNTAMRTRGANHKTLSKQTLET
eukprot:gene14027-15486_t